MSVGIAVLGHFPGQFCRTKKIVLAVNVMRYVYFTIEYSSLLVRTDSTHDARTHVFRSAAMGEM